MFSASSSKYLIQDNDESERADADEDVQQYDEVDVLQKINPLRKPMSMLSVDTREFSTEAPEDRSTALTNAQPEQWTSFAPAPIAFAWAAPNIRYQPLFFENVPLERYGQTPGPWKEVGRGSLHFFSSLALWPYHARFDHIYECDSPLGFCRPGSQVASKRQLQFWGW
jgi:hypothetical protein